MIKTQDAISAARALIGTPYSALDCINLIKKVIRVAPGGVKKYTTAGTNTLWDSLFVSAKYRDLTWRQESIDGARAGMLAFKRRGEDVHHVGLVTDVGTVIHSSSTGGGRGVVETPLSEEEGWNALAIHRHIAVSQAATHKSEAAQKAQENKEQAKEQASGGEAAGVIIIDEAGERFYPAGSFRVYLGSVD